MANYSSHSGTRSRCATLSVPCTGTSQHGLRSGVMSFRLRTCLFDVASALCYSLPVHYRSTTSHTGRVLILTTEVNQL